VCLGTASFDTIQVKASLSIDPKTRVTAALPSVLAVQSCRLGSCYVVGTVRTMQSCRRNIGVARFDGDLCSSFRWVVSFTLQPQYPYCGPYSRFARFVEASVVSAASKGEWDSRRRLLYIGDNRNCQKVALGTSRRMWCSEH